MSEQKIGRAADLSMDHTPAEGQDGLPECSSPEIKLKSLAPEFKGDDHDLYVRHLEDAVKDTRNRNIALTGRYGAGKSSVLDKFEENHASETVRISINTLGPDEDDEDLTNRIQKELVKQLVYRLRPGQIRRSRFARPKPLTHGRAFAQSLGVTGIGLTLLWLFGVRPANGWPGEDLTSAGKVLLGAAFFALVLFGVWSIRWAIGDRFVSEVSTAGTKIALSEGPTTYFDSYLDEIVSFFDAVEPEFVIFEDLDRFDDPQIFDSLRELNTLINASAHWKEKNKPLRFIYAIKDSLFEQLGVDSRRKKDPVATEDPTESEAADRRAFVVEPDPDYAADAVRRANRTKFFEMVIPIVPFLSHRNARDHLSDALTGLGYPKDFVSRPLLDLAARYTTDMRLMINICNEFAVFVERLLWNKNPAPGMTSDDIFALVTYKNFHLADFEDIAQRASSLDQLERFHRDEVRALVDSLQARRREKLRTEEHRIRKEQTAALLGERLLIIANLYPSHNNWSTSSLTVDGEEFPLNAINEVEFWARVAKSQSIGIKQQYSNNVVELDTDMLTKLFPEVSRNVNDWLDPDPAELERLLRNYSDDIIMLKGADFAELSNYKWVPTGRTPFKKRINDVLKSDLARELVLKGFITRNYAEYSAMFYGSFVGVDVAYFYNHSVQPNEMYIDFHFTSKGAVSNLLEQVPEDFASTDSALNIEVIEFLLTNRPKESKEIAAYIISNDTRTEVQAFLSAYFNTPDSSHATLIGLLSAHPWRRVFEYVAGHPELPDDETRLSMFDAAVLGMQEIGSYEIGPESSEFLRINYSRMQSVLNEHSPAQIEKVSDLIEMTAFVVPDLGFLSLPLRERIVAAHLYEIRVSNLKLALGSDEVPCLDEVRKNDHVWKYCSSKISNYIEVMDVDTNGECLIRSERVLIEIANEQIEQWSDDELRAVIKGSEISATVVDLNDIPKQIWPMLVQFHRVSPSAANVQAYTNALGVDAVLASFLSPETDQAIALQNVDDIESDTRTQLAVSLLNASDRLSARERVVLAAQLITADEFSLAEITAAPDQLLARGLEANIFKDDLGTFTHFAPGGWAAMSDAFTVSSKVSTFMAPAIVQGFVADFIKSPTISKDLKKLVLEDLPRYVPNEDALALGAAGEFAKAESIRLPLQEVRRIARVARDPSSTMRQLVLSWSDFGPDRAVEILSTLGTPYDKLVAGPGTTFDYPSNVTSIDTVFRYLEQAGRIKVLKKLSNRGKVVEVLV